MNRVQKYESDVGNNTRRDGEHSERPQQRTGHGAYMGQAGLSACTRYSHNGEKTC